jgi:hypothetical protein
VVRLFKLRARLSGFKVWAVGVTEKLIALTLAMVALTAIVVTLVTGVAIAAGRRADAFADHVLEPHSASTSSAVPSAPTASVAPVPVAAGPAPRAGVTYMETAGSGDPLRLQCGTTVFLDYHRVGEPYDASPVIAAAAPMVAAALGVPVTTKPGVGPEDRIDIGWTSSLSPSGSQVETLGEAGPSSDSNGVYLAGGDVTLSESAVLPEAPGGDIYGAGSELAVVLHEIGHTLDLDHPSDPAQAEMAAVLDPSHTPGYDAAEAAALHWIGTSDCTKPSN